MPEILENKERRKYYETGNRWFAKRRKEYII